MTGVHLPPQRAHHAPEPATGPVRPRRARAPGRDTPLNPFHTRELSAAEVAEMLERDFVVTRMMGLSHGPRLRRWERRHGSVMDQQLAGPPESWSPELRRFVFSVTADDFVVSATDVDASLDLVAVAYRRP